MSKKEKIKAREEEKRKGRRKVRKKKTEDRKQ